MKISLRTRLFLGMSGLIVFFVAFSLVLNSQFLGRYYIGQKRASLVESAKMIDNLYKGDPESIALELENLERNRGINISILSPDYELKYNTSFRLFSLEHGRKLFELLPLPPHMMMELQDLDIGEYIMDVATDPRLKTNFLALAARLSNGEMLVLNTPIAAINEGTAIANRFFLFTGLLTIVLGGIAVFLFANRFTKPILELNDIAQEMSKLNFSRKYPVQSEDEVGQLGQSINSLSDQLDKAISELKEANEILKEDIERERRIDKMRKEFISNVSHELKTPIALIQGYAEGLKLNVNEDEESRNFYCDVIMDEADKMNRLVKDLLDLSQIESGYLKLEKTVFEVSAFIEHVLEKFRPIFAEKGIRLDVKNEKSLFVYGDVVRIEQVLINYLNNAINHIDESKIIRIEVTCRNNKVRVSVYNSGNPIPEDSLDKIWTSFYKVDKARTRTYGGTGLGLSVVRGILEAHHNAYGAENKDDGVLFWFEIDEAEC
ncbi:integral membrane sensor signal transduction histidine kinase [Thermincola ferriacetica]|uniref:histidine kinase n=1 Tax=Thermincola ferriacetica TaxID=281456 RepID=A0A0L6W300_9FIRM|nr:HAMP domain-containing sensor histidine kinase [Thermincola ferriacetica]KNZ69942.1 integral membrane sensor signal transduction histidine kinase [Thermincola ferriacetica]